VLKSRGLTCADIAGGLGLSEATVKRIFSRRDFTLERIDEICRIAGVDFAELTRAECTRCLARLDRLRIIELAPGDRIRPLVSRAFSWRPGGPIQRYFHARIQDEYLGSRFDRPDELFLFTSGMLSHASSAELLTRLRRVARDFAEQHREDLGLPLADRVGTSLLIALRPWEPRSFRQLRRAGVRGALGGRLLQLQQGGRHRRTGVRAGERASRAPAASAGRT